MATVLTIESGAVDRAASLGAFSQFPDEEEYLWTPLSYVEPEPEERQEIEMFARCGVVRIVPVRVNVNLKSQTIEEIQGQRKVILESQWSTFSATICRPSCCNTLTSAGANPLTNPRPLGPRKNTLTRTIGEKSKMCSQT